MVWRGVGAAPEKDWVNQRAGGEASDGWQCIKAETRKILSSSFPSPASIILPFEKGKVKMIEQQRLKVGFALFIPESEDTCSENISSASLYLRAVLLSATGGRFFSSAGLVAASSAQPPSCKCLRWVMSPIPAAWKHCPNSWGTWKTGSQACPTFNILSFFFLIEPGEMFKNNYSPIKQVGYEDNNLYKMPRELLEDCLSERKIHQEVETISPTLAEGFPHPRFKVGW